MSPSRSTLALVSIWATLMTVACTADPDQPDEPDDNGQEAQEPQQPRTSLPGEEIVVLEDGAAAPLAITVSQQLYDEAPVVLLAGEEDTAGQRAAAGDAANLGVPLLLTPPPSDPAAESPGASTPPATGSPDAGDQADALREELARLGAGVVGAYGAGPAQWSEQLGDGVEVVAVQAGESTAPPGTPSPAPTPGTAALPPVTPPEPLSSLTVLIDGEADHTVAATATARAAGAQVVATKATDPRADPEVIEALAEEPPSHTMAVGGFGPAGRLRDRLAVAATGVQLPGGGQRLFPGRTFVALYGHPGTPVLGVLGEQPRAEAIERAQEVAAEYESVVDEPVIPALEIITTIASASAGPQGDYSRRTPVDQLRPWVDAAREAGVYVVLDLQPGRTDFLSQAKQYEELLTEPHVGLALDPEWRLAADQRHMVQIGSVGAAEVNRVVEWLADLTAAHQLPQKLLILHQFTLQMIRNRDNVETGRDELAVLIHADGFGTPGQKRSTWNALHVDAPPDVWWGWKNFYDEDRPTFSPAQTMKMSPAPVFVSYQ